MKENWVLFPDKLSLFYPQEDLGWSRALTAPHLRGHTGIFNCNRSSSSSPFLVHLVKMLESPPVFNTMQIMLDLPPKQTQWFQGIFRIPTEAPISHRLMFIRNIDNYVSKKTSGWQAVASGQGKAGSQIDMNSGATLLFPLCMSAHVEQWAYVEVTS